ncbi:MAG: hypothetical protein DMG27_19435 [Acidobacteria bacterium]|nr:MAG: hypothetical protein DMG27_19435 [Acidobacteriota bacterium]
MLAIEGSVKPGREIRVSPTLTEPIRAWSSGCIMCSVSARAVRGSCGRAPLDVGGACGGVVYALMAAKSLLCTASRHVALVVASEVNSRRLARSQAPGEFRGLFGDAACALVLTRSAGADGGSINRLGDFVCGCSGTFASALEMSLGERGQLDVQFKGEQLASAAIGTLDRVLGDLEIAVGKPRSAASYFALHEPNPRVVEIFAHRSGIPAEKIAMVSRTSGNLGSATCGVSLCAALTRAQRDSDNSSAPSMPLIFVAAVGPGLVWAGTYIH